MNHVQECQEIILSETVHDVSNLDYLCLLTYFAAAGVLDFELLVKFSNGSSSWTSLLVLAAVRTIKPRKTRTEEARSRSINPGAT